MTAAGEIFIANFLRPALLKDPRSCSADRAEIRSNRATHAQDIFHWEEKCSFEVEKQIKKQKVESERKEGEVKKESRIYLTLEHFVACL